MRSAKKIVRRYLNIEMTRGYLKLPGFFRPEGAFVERLLALAEALGQPSTIDGGQAVWDVRPTAIHGTFSQTAAPAAFHTDGAYLDRPPAHFLLACIRPASNGGTSLFLSTRKLHDSLRLSGWSENDLEALKQPAWSWRVPEVFRSVDKPDPSTPKSVLSEDGSIAWREDNLVPTSSKQDEVGRLLAAHLKRSVGEADAWRLKSGDAVICSNRFLLHARTGFTDTNRHLLRIRIA